MSKALKPQKITTKEDWVQINNKIKQTGTNRCFTYKTRIQCKNPLANCYECNKRFCYDHIYCNQYNDKMKLEDEVRDVCLECIEKFNYKTL